MEMNADQVELIKRTVALGSTDDELKMFLYQCQRTQLDPFSRQIHMIKRGGRATIQVGIDGYRAIAERTGLYAGNDEYLFNGGLTEFECMKNNNTPEVATATIRKIVSGNVCVFTASASWREYCPKGQDFMWKKMPYLMLGKCAEALALRKAFPNDLSGIYTDEEMAQAGDVKEQIVTKTVNKVEDLKKKLEPKQIEMTDDERGHMPGDEDIPKAQESPKRRDMSEKQESKIREYLESPFIDKDVIEKVTNWLDSDLRPTMIAANDTIKKLESKIEEAEKSTFEKELDDIPF